MCSHVTLADVNLWLWNAGYIDVGVQLLHALELKKSLVEDWERVARQRKLLQLPPKVHTLRPAAPFLGGTFIRVCLGYSSSYAR